MLRPEAGPRTGFEQLLRRLDHFRELMYRRAKLVLQITDADSVQYAS